LKIQPNRIFTTLKFVFQEMTEKSVTMQGSDSEADVTIDKVENVNFVGRAVSASKPGPLCFSRVEKNTLRSSSKK